MPDASGLDLCKCKAVEVVPTRESGSKEEALMAVGVLLEFPGVTREQYEQLAQDMGLSGLPEGVIIHVCRTERRLTGSASTRTE